MFLRRLLSSGLVVALGIPLHGGISEPAAPAARPKLVVLLVVDQMRADYIERYSHQWKGGLKRLVERGAWFRQAAYPYWNTVTCAGHSTIGTGAIPATHGMVLNAWWDRGLERNTPCTEDPTVKNIGVNGASSAPRGESAWRLMVPTLADEMRTQLAVAPRVVSLSMKARSAIGMAGHRGDAVVWHEGGWQTSDYYARAVPPFVAEYSRARPLEEERRKKWDRLLPQREYLFEDDGPGEKPTGGDGRSFPHSENLPASDAALADLAKAALKTYALGKGPGTDFLAIGFSALDTVGHDYGPNSHEVQDVLARLDAVAGGLLAHLDLEVGPQNYVLALSADHGVSPIPEQMSAAGVSAGRIDSRELTQKVEQALAPLLGPGPHVARYNYTELYFKPGVYAKLQASAEAMKAAESALLSARGIWRVFRSEELPGLRGSADPVARAAAMSYYPGRSGDMIVLARPYWFASSSAATHGSGHAYDQRVPVILYGAGVKPGTYLSEAGPQDIAPTLAFLVGVTLSRADGRVLNDALEQPRRAPGSKAKSKND
jgi:predicted AlkP superfamily pyrophosphatase or phosphodiesterase